jgi:predicted metalloprotease with PDZ domain
MRTAFQKYSGTKGYTADQFRAIAEEVAGTRLGAFWDRAVESTEELEYGEALETFGLRFKSVEAPNPDRPAKAWLGAATRNDAGRLVVTQVRRNTPAYEAGINADDEIIAIDDFRLRADRFDNRLEQYKPGDQVSVLLARREQLLRVNVTLGSEPAKEWRVEIDSAANESQRAQLKRWLEPALYSN